jgi:hypothetical protein
MIYSFYRFFLSHLRLCIDRKAIKYIVFREWEREGRYCRVGREAKVKAFGTGKASWQGHPLSTSATDWTMA